ncbi:class I SAM-dependent RNA methyltransferase [Nocardia higoensis]|uniref:Class I SAM-dependent RNA methyltransferase n=1 Tax=Nocardia higoensis TaxID=228599 RepID=A0ABS0DCQ4_9NOCA|nr:class I SAM-dependent RNA methyltransferase [Nocardia higoensis]MBF6354508.1 class I SAM-dependent RNA methyltransferase [Nocardia higoensis]
MSDWLGQTFEIRLGPPGHGGFCVGRHEGRVVFVRHGLPGEVVLARVTEDAGGGFCRADAIEILESSADRVPSTCPVSGPGGAGCCDFAYATPAAQRALKASVVGELLRRIGGLDREVTVEPISERSAEATGGWRTRVRLPVDASGRAGIHRYRSDAVIADLRCPQPVPGMLADIAEQQWTPGADLVIALDGDGLRHIVELAPAAPQHRGRTDRGGGRRGPAGRRGAAAARRAAAHAPRAERIVEGSGRAVEYVAGRRWEVSATGFWQAHRDAAQCYSDLIGQWAELSGGDSAWDLYSGAGVFAARLAEQVGPGGAVLAVESSRAAVADGRAALRDQPWVDLRSDRVERWLAEHIAQTPRVVVLDPPRAGAGKDVVTAVTAAGPERIVHIGCDPAAFARDLGLYGRAGYELADLRVFDAFPATHHVECVALLTR